MAADAARGRTAHAARARSAVAVLLGLVGVAFAAWTLVLAVQRVAPGPLNLGVSCGSVLSPAPAQRGLITDCASSLPAQRHAVEVRAIVAVVALAAVPLWLEGTRTVTRRAAAVHP